MGNLANSCEFHIHERKQKLSRYSVVWQKVFTSTKVFIPYPKIRRERINKEAY